MAKKKAGLGDQPEKGVMPEAATDQAEDGQEEEEQSAEGEKVSKMEAVRRLLADDPEMKPGEGIQAVKQRFGLDMTTGNFSAYKSQILAKGKQGGGQGKGRKKAATDVGKQAAAPAGGADPLEAAEAVKALVDRYGAKTVKGLADLFDNQ